MVLTFAIVLRQRRSDGKVAWGRKIDDDTISSTVIGFSLVGEQNKEDEAAEFQTTGWDCTEVYPQDPGALNDAASGFK